MSNDIVYDIASYDMNLKLVDDIVSNDIVSYDLVWYDIASYDMNLKLVDDIVSNDIISYDLIWYDCIKWYEF